MKGDCIQFAVFIHIKHRLSFLMDSQKHFTLSLLNLKEKSNPCKLSQTIFKDFDTGSIQYGLYSVNLDGQPEIIILLLRALALSSIQSLYEQVSENELFTLGLYFIFSYYKRITTDAELKHFIYNLYQFKFIDVSENFSVGKSHDQITELINGANAIYQSLEDNSAEESLLWLNSWQDAICYLMNKFDRKKIFAIPIESIITDHLGFSEDMVITFNYLFYKTAITMQILS